MDKSKEIAEIIKDLIKSKKEGVYWDFKREPHNDMADLILDILCLANCSHPGDRYLIIGVSDPYPDCEIVGLDTDQKCRKKKAQLIDTLKRVKFAGDIRPDIDLETIIVDDKEIDVIVIKDRPYKPYMLSEDKLFKPDKSIEKKNAKEDLIRAGVVYTRVGDTNTSKNRTADLIHIEHMWKQRFGLDLAPIDRIYSLLKKPDEWRNTLNYTHYTYHNTFSEFNIEVIDIKDDNSEISHYYPDCNSFRGRMIIKQGNVPLDEYPCFFTDSTNKIILKPKIKLLSFSHKAIFFYLLTEDNLGILNNFLLRGKVEKLEQIYYRTPILLFDSFDDLVNFSRKALENIELIEKYNVSKNKSIELYRFLDNHHPKYDLQILMFQIEMFYNEWVINEKLTLKELL